MAQYGYYFIASLSFIDSVYSYIEFELIRSIPILIFIISTILWIVTIKKKRLLE